MVPVLFVHGHLGTHQQMRSAAAETGRELARRLEADSTWPLWLQWYGADFGAEASALDPDLLVREGGDCGCRWLLDAAIDKCQYESQHVPPAWIVPLPAPFQCRTAKQTLCCTASGTCSSCMVAGWLGPSRLSSGPSASCWWPTAWEEWWRVTRCAAWPLTLGLVRPCCLLPAACWHAYSEHSVAARLSGLSAGMIGSSHVPAPAADLGQVVALVTLGSPHHFPKLLPNRRLSELLPLGSRNATAPAGATTAAAAAAAAAGVPRANIAAGAADYFLPHTLGGAGAPVRPGEQPELSLLMRDMPGVWTTCGHKVRLDNGCLWGNAGTKSSVQQPCSVRNVSALLILRLCQAH